MTKDCAVFHNTYSIVQDNSCQEDEAAQEAGKTWIQGKRMVRNNCQAGGYRTGLATALQLSTDKLGV